MTKVGKLIDRQFLRYQRQISLPEIGEAGQLKLINSRVLIIGCGGLGNAAALYLAAAGAGRLVLADGDVVEESNLQRQVAYREFDNGNMKAAALLDQLNELNPDIDIDISCRYLKGGELTSLVATADVVLDCSDNFTTRQEVNQVCAEHRVPLISGAAIGWKGQLICFDFHQEASACYHCLYPFDHSEQPANCNQAGIAGPVVGIIGTAQALQAVKYLAGAGSPSWSSLHLFDALSFEWQVLSLTRDKACPVCGGGNNESVDHNRGVTGNAYMA